MHQAHAPQAAVVRHRVPLSSARQAITCWNRRTGLRCRCEKQTSASKKQEKPASSKTTTLAPTQLQQQEQQVHLQLVHAADQLLWSSLICNTMCICCRVGKCSIGRPTKVLETSLGGATVAATMSAWIISFAGTAFIAMPWIYTQFVGQPVVGAGACRPGRFCPVERGCRAGSHCQSSGCRGI